MKIFICKKCQMYCNVLAAMLSDCCEYPVYLPQRTKEEKRATINPAV